MADQGTEGLLSPWLRQQRVAVAKPYLWGRVLDVGCGSGALAASVDPDYYLGVDVCKESLQLARSCYPLHHFVSSLPEAAESFDTVVSLAVIEHVANPAEFLCNLAGCLSESEAARLIVTTPHPSVDWIHDLGATLGLFSKHANEEHEDLLDRVQLELAGTQAGLGLVTYRRFLLGANQVAVYKRCL